MAGGKGGGIHEVECGQVAVSIGGGGMEWNVGSVEIVQEDEEEQVVDPREVVCEGRWEVQKAERKRNKRRQRKAAVKSEESEGVFIGAVDKEVGDRISMGFQVCEVRKALAGVHRIFKVGNIVHFGEKEEECFIKK